MVREIQVPAYEGAAWEEKAMALEQNRALATRQNGSTELSIVAESGFTPEQIQLIKDTIATGATDDELKLFLYQCGRTKLDPFARQIYAIKRYDATKKREAMAIQVSIDGFRLVASRTGDYVPGRETTYTYKPDGSLESATAYVKRHSHNEWHEIAATAYFDEYAQWAKPRDGGAKYLTIMWKEKPRIMLAKCAESLALRKAFPAELSGLYSAAEMGQGGEIEDDEPKMLPPAAKASAALLGPAVASPVAPDDPDVITVEAKRLPLSDDFIPSPSELTSRFNVIREKAEKDGRKGDLNKLWRELQMRGNDFNLLAPMSQKRFVREAEEMLGIAPA